MNAFDRLSSWTPQMLAVLRIMTALLFIEHGTAKLFGFPQDPTVANVQLASLIGLAGILEVFGGLLILIGLCTRPAAFVLAGFMVQRLAKRRDYPWLMFVAAVAIPLYERFLTLLRDRLPGRVETGEFGADMRVELVNDGPVTLILER